MFVKYKQQTLTEDCENDVDDVVIEQEMNIITLVLDQSKYFSNLFPVSICKY